MFLKRPTEGSTSSAKGRTVQLSESTEEKTEHLPSKDMKESWYVDVLSSTPAALRKHKCALIKKREVAGWGHLVALCQGGLISYSGKENFHSATKWGSDLGEGIDGQPCLHCSN